jgi:hypothetical protein
VKSATLALLIAVGMLVLGVLAIAAVINYAQKVKRRGG